jgi:hypothetical protein
MSKYVFAIYFTYLFLPFGFGTQCRSVQRLFYWLKYALHMCGVQELQKACACNAIHAHALLREEQIEPLRLLRTPAVVVREEKDLLRQREA